MAGPAETAQDRQSAGDWRAPPWRQRSPAEWAPRNRTRGCRKCCWGSTSPECSESTGSAVDYLQEPPAPWPLHSRGLEPPVERQAPPELPEPEAWWAMATPTTVPLDLLAHKPIGWGRSQRFAPLLNTGSLGRHAGYTCSWDSREGSCQPQERVRWLQCWRWYWLDRSRLFCEQSARVSYETDHYKICSSFIQPDSTWMITSWKRNPQLFWVLDFEGRPILAEV